MTRIAFITLAVLAFLVERCEEKQASTHQVAAMRVTGVSIPDTIQLGQPIAFEVTCSAPTPCWEFTKFEIKQDGRSYDIEVLAEYDGRPCIQTLGSFKAKSSVVPKERGAFTFRFAKAQAAESTIVIVR